MRRQRGFSLFEVLVAVFVLGVGLVGIAGLQVTSKQSNFEAVQRATAVALAQDIIERMRANPDELAVYTNAGAGRTLTGGTMAAANCSAGCTPAQLAQYDLYQWEQVIDGITAQNGAANRGGLTLPTACITGPNGGSGTYVVAIAWRGLTKLSDPSIDPCGQGSGRYDSEGGVEADVYRRVLQVATYIAEPV
jgi:type IV pilus assembly protein PilV